MSEHLNQVTIIDKAIHRLQPGEMTYDRQQNGWFIGCPGCKGVGNLTTHTVTEHEGVVTASPSILCGCGAHYFIVQNQIRWC